MQPFHRLPPRAGPGRSPDREPARPATPEPDDPFQRELEAHLQGAAGPDPLAAGGGVKRGRDWDELDDVAQAAPASRDPWVAASLRALEALAAHPPRRPVDLGLPPARAIDRRLRNVATAVEHPPDGDYQAGPFRLTLLSTGPSTLTAPGASHVLAGHIVSTLALLVANHDRVVLLDDLHRLTGSSIDTAGRNVTRLRKLGLKIHCDRVMGTNPPVTAGYRLDTQGVPEGYVPAALAPQQRRSRAPRAHQAHSGAGAASSRASSLPSGSGSPNK